MDASNCLQMYVSFVIFTLLITEKVKLILITLVTFQSLVIVINFSLITLLFSMVRYLFAGSAQLSMCFIFQMEFFFFWFPQSTLNFMGMLDIRWTSQNAFLFE